MLTRKLSNGAAALAAGLLAGLLSQTAGATEEIVVYGGKAAVSREAALQSQMKEYAQSLNEALKATLDKELENLRAPKLELAVGEISTRG